jgi:gag-polypeptide of LTR copia-type
LDKEGEEGPEDDYVNNFPISHDVHDSCMIEGTKDPVEMWTILEGQYKPKTRVTLRQLQRQFNTMKMMDDDGDMEKHLQKVERLKRQIDIRGARRANLRFKLRQRTPQLCTFTIRYSDQYSRSTG